MEPLSHPKLSNQPIQATTLSIVGSNMHFQNLQSTANETMSHPHSHLRDNMMEDKVSDNKSALELHHYLVTGYLRQNGFGNSVVANDLSLGIIVHNIDEYTPLVIELSANDTVFNIVGFYARYNSNGVQVRFVLRDQNNSAYLCDPSNQRQLLQPISDACLRQTGFELIYDETMQQEVGHSKSLNIT